MYPMMLYEFAIQAEHTPATLADTVVGIDWNLICAERGLTCTSATVNMQVDREQLK
jgi:hypothetical protein